MKVENKLEFVLGQLCSGPWTAFPSRYSYLLWQDPSKGHLGSPAFADVCAKSLSHVQCFVTLWTVAHQAPLSIGFSRQEYWRELSCPPPGDLLNPRTEPTSPVSPALQAESLPTEPSSTNQLSSEITLTAGPSLKWYLISMKSMPVSLPSSLHCESCEVLWFRERRRSLGALSSVPRSFPLCLC